MSAGQELPPVPERPLRSGPFAFHPLRALAGGGVGALVGMVIYAATDRWQWLLLALACSVALAFDFWWIMLSELDD